MKKLILFLLLATSLSIKGQSFTNTVDQMIGHNTKLDYELRNNSQHTTVSQPLSLWFSYSGVPTTIEGELNHRGDSFDFTTILGSQNPVVVSPINSFYGDFTSGNWQLNLHSDSPFKVHQWGISTIPEPTTIVLAGIGLASLLIFRRRK